MLSDKPFFIQLLGTRKNLLFAYILNLHLPKTYKTQYIDTPEDITPDADIVLCSGVHYIIDAKYLNISRLGVWGFHETDLPEGKGCAPLSWTVLNKKNLTVSFFELAPKLDTGRILGKETYKIEDTDLIGDIRLKSFRMIETLIRYYLDDFLCGRIEPVQQTGTSTYYRKRDKSDSEIDINKSIKDQWDLIRVCDNKDYPVWFEIDNKKFTLKVEHEHNTC